MLRTWAELSPVFFSCTWRIVGYCMNGLSPNRTCVVVVRICVTLCPDDSNDIPRFHIGVCQARDSNWNCPWVYIGLNCLSFGWFMLAFLFGRVRKLLHCKWNVTCHVGSNGWGALGTQPFCEIAADEHHQFQKLLQQSRMEPIPLSWWPLTSSHMWKGCANISQALPRWLEHYTTISCRSVPLIMARHSNRKCRWLYVGLKCVSFVRFGLNI